MEHIAKENMSEVARIRVSIEIECVALHNLSLFSSTGSHDIINAKYKNLYAHYQELRALMGDDESISAIVAIYNAVM